MSEDTKDRADPKWLLEDALRFGRYQICLCALMVTPSAFICALLYFTQFFIILIPSHHCSIGANNETDLKNNIPYDLKNGQIVYDSCHVFDRPNNDSSSSFNRTLIECPNGWHYDYQSIDPTMASESNWVCKHNRQPYVVQTIFFAGTSIGCIIFGFVSDRFGRKPSIIISSLLACFAGISSAFTFDFWSFSALRFLVGMTIIPLSEDPFVLCLEYLSVEKRTMATVFWTIGYISSSIVCPWIAYSIKSWRVLCVITSCPLFLILFGFKWIPESASWLITRGRTDEAISLLERVAKVNKRVTEESTVGQCILQESVITGTKLQTEEPSVSIIDLFGQKRMRRRILALAVCWFILFVCYHTNTQNSSNVASDVYTSFTFGALMEIPATIFVYLAIDRLGRRWPMAVSMLISGAAGLSALALSDNRLADNYFLMVTLVMRVSLATEYNILMQYSTEVFPTVLRGRALALLRVVGTLGLYVSPSIVYLSTESQSLPLVVTGGLSIVCALLSLFLPETMDQNLPHTFEEGEAFGKDQTIFKFNCIY